MTINDFSRRLSTTTPIRLMLCASALFLIASTSPRAHPHPHDEREILEVKGTLARVDLVHRMMEVDIFDRTTRTTRNLALAVDKKVKIRNGKTRVDLAALQPGQQVTCTVEREHQEGRSPRLTVFEIRLDPRS
jgi:hypothetical protein